MRKIEKLLKMHAKDSTSKTTFFRSLKIIFILREADNLEVRQFIFSDFGKSCLKTFRLSPDSFIQIAFQLTYYRLHKSHPPTYETGTLRKYAEGRTDTIRLPNIESVEFVETMPIESLQLISTSMDYIKLATQLVRAVQAHKDYSNLVMNGK